MRNSHIFINLVDSFQSNFHSYLFIAFHFNLIFHQSMMNPKNLFFVHRANVDLMVDVSNILIIVDDRRRNINGFVNVIKDGLVDIVQFELTVHVHQMLFVLVILAMIDQFVFVQHTN